jgi:hypothetical protein
MPAAVKPFHYHNLGLLDPIAPLWLSGLSTKFPAFVPPLLELLFLIDALGHVLSMVSSASLLTHAG